MDCWSEILKVPFYPNGKAHYRVAVSLCLSSTSRRLVRPSANVIFFNGDRVEGTGNPAIERLSDPQKIAEILLSKFGGFVNAWVIEASTFNGPFAVYKDFIPFINSWGDPKSYNPNGFPASVSTVTLLSHCLQEVRSKIAGRPEEQHEAEISASCSHIPKSIVLGFSKGGTVLNQLVTELGFSPVKSSDHPPSPSNQPIKVNHVNICGEDLMIPGSKESFLNSIREIHYVDVGLNSKGAYLTDSDAIERISKRVTQGDDVIRFFFHGTPRQWCDNRRVWIKHEKDKLIQMIKSGACKNGGRIQVFEKFYFADKPPSMLMHFEIIEELDVG